MFGVPSSDGLRTTALTTLLLTASLAGCENAHRGASTALDSTDLLQATDSMAMKLAADPAVRAALAEHRPLIVVCQPVENEMTAEVLPAGPSHAFVARVRTLLSTHVPTDFIWVMNRDSYYALRGQELDRSTLGPAPEAMNPTHALTATFQTLTHATKERRGVYYLCRYQLLDLRTRQVIWTDAYETKKSVMRGFLD